MGPEESLLVRPTNAATLAAGAWTRCGLGELHRGSHRVMLFPRPVEAFAIVLDVFAVVGL